jgi:hypothetical protein
MPRPPLARDKLQSVTMRMVSQNGHAELQPVRIDYHDHHSRTVSVAGSFNHWRPAPLVHVGFGWWIRIFFLPPGRFEFRLLLDDAQSPTAVQMTEPPPAARKGKSLPASIRIAESGVSYSQKAFKSAKMPVMFQGSSV